MSSVVLSSVVLSLTGLLFVSLSPPTLFVSVFGFISLSFSSAQMNLFHCNSHSVLMMSTVICLTVLSFSPVISDNDYEGGGNRKVDEIRDIHVADLIVMSSLLKTLLSCLWSLCFKSYFDFRSVSSLRRRFQQFSFSFEIHSVDTVQVKVFFSPKRNGWITWFMDRKKSITSPLILGNYKCTFVWNLCDPLFFLFYLNVHRFRACLKAAKTPVSDMIGKLFFNIAKTKCFSFKREKTCKKRSWWGKCLKSKRSKKAFFKGGLSYWISCQILG